MLNLEAWHASLNDTEYIEILDIKVFFEKNVYVGIFLHLTVLVAPHF